MHFVAAPAKFRDDIFRKEFGIAPRHVGIDIFHVQHGIEHFDEMIHQLDFVEQDIIIVIIFDLFFDSMVSNSTFPHQIPQQSLYVSALGGHPICQ